MYGHVLHLEQSFLWRLLWYRGDVNFPLACTTLLRTKECRWGTFDRHLLFRVLWALDRLSAFASSEGRANIPHRPRMGCLLWHHSFLSLPGDDERLSFLSLLLRFLLNQIILGWAIVNAGEVVLEGLNTVNVSGECLIFCQLLDIDLVEASLLSLDTLHVFLGHLHDDKLLERRKILVRPLLDRHQPAGKIINWIS